MDIDKLTRYYFFGYYVFCFSTLLDIDKLTLLLTDRIQILVLVLCWILINLHETDCPKAYENVLVPCWILINLHVMPGMPSIACVLVLCWILINLHVYLHGDTLHGVLVLCWILINLHVQA